MRASRHRLARSGTRRAAAGDGDSAPEAEHPGAPEHRTCRPGDGGHARAHPDRRPRRPGSALATCLLAVPLGVAVLEYVLQHERGHLGRIASDVAIDVYGDVYDRTPIDPDDL